MKKKKRTRLSHDDRKALILKVAINLSLEIGYTNITSRVIAERSGINHALVFYYFETMENLHEVIMKTAVKDEILNLVLQGILFSHPVALNAPKKLKQKARNF